MNNRPKVGIGVPVVKEGKILLGKRKNSHGEGTWCPPGGHLEFGETWEDCANRETKEEAGIDVMNLRLALVTKDEDKHYVSIIMICDHKNGEAEVMEPDTFKCWNWFTWEQLPTPLFIPLQNIVKSGYHPLH